MDKFRQELAAREAAKQHRLYPHSPAPAHGCSAAAAAASGQGSPGAGGHLARPVSPAPPHRHPPQQQQEPAVTEEGGSVQQQEPASQPGGDSCNGGGGEGRAAGRPSAGSAGTAAAAAPAIGSAEWEAAQRVHEDAHMGHFERIIPSDDPEKQVGPCWCGRGWRGGEQGVAKS